MLLLGAVCFFLAFERMRPFIEGRINKVASTTFGIYLLHANTGILPVNWIWTEVFRSAEYQNTIWLIPYSILSALLVFAVGLILDLVRQKVFERMYIKLIDRLLPLLTSRLNILRTWVEKAVFGRG